MDAIDQPARQVLLRVCGALAEIVVVEMPAGFTSRRDRCPDGQFWLPVSGEQLIEGAGPARRQSPFELRYYAPREPAQRTTSLPTLAYGLRVRLSLMTTEEVDTSWIHGRNLDWQANRLALNIILKGLSNKSDTHGLDEAVAQWVGAASRTRDEKGQTVWMKLVEDLLIDEPSLSLLDLSRRVGLVPAYVSAQFSRNRGITISAFRRQVMLKRTLSLASRSTLNEAAIEAGFYDASHFHRACVSDLNVKPSTLRQLIWPVSHGASRRNMNP